ncbi:type I glyceraldehyde-3-phosphate dehydrogenase [Candidatus Micrarchaeota archaeon]|nr:type I glyceraldehyde-3-phosphate dehydrogenase [Candidatus Micrarchaeota archaeon]
MNIAINGFGRIGRSAFKICLDKGLKVVAINNTSGDPATHAHLLKHDSNYGNYERKVEATTDSLIVDGKKTLVLSERDPAKLPWKKLGVDIVLECTGHFTDAASAKAHLIAGAKRVIISAPAKDNSPTFVLGVNKSSGKHEVISNASCTTNCITPVIDVLENAFGIKKAMMTTVHAYTADQNLQDGTHKDLRRARNAADNIVPTTTGAAKTTIKIITSLQNKFDGLSIRVPVKVVSLSDITAVLKKPVTVEQVNDAFKKASKNPRYSGILGVTEEELVSSDFIKDSRSAIVDLPLTMVVDGDLVKVVAWYDNEWGYSCRLVELAIEVGKKL